MGILRIVAIILILCTPALAEDIYIASSSAGGDTGVDCSNAHSLAWLNTSDNWGSGADKVSAGDTVHLCGTFTGSSGASVITIQGSGSSGSPVTIKFETDAIIESPYFGDSTAGGIYCSSKNYITIDGGTNGIMRNTANGTLLANHAASTAVMLNGCDNVIVKNLTFRNLFVPATITGINSGTSEDTCTDSLSRDMTTLGVRTGMRATNTTTGSSNSSGITSVSGSTFVRTLNSGGWNDGDGWKVMEVPQSPRTSAIYALSCSDVSITNVDVQYAGWSILWGANDDSNFSVTNSTFKSIGVGVAAGTTASGTTATNLTVSGNTISDMDVWGYTDGIKLYSGGDASGAFTQIHIYGNTIGPNIGTATAHILINPGTFTDPVHGPLIYNNLLLSGVNDNPTAAISVGGKTGSTTDVAAHIFNNTYVSLYSGSDIGIHLTYNSTGHIIKNNVISYPNSTGTLYAIYYNDANSSAADVDFNAYYIPSGALRFGTGSTTLAQWQSTYGFDGNATTSNPLLSSVGVPSSSSHLIDAGTDLSSYFITDIIGTTRPKGDAYDIGAYEYESGAALKGSISGSGSFNMR